MYALKSCFVRIPSKIVFPRLVKLPDHRFNRTLASMTQNDCSSRGAFIVFEGADRAGKSTQCEMLVENLKNQGVRLIISQVIK